MLQGLEKNNNFITPLLVEIVNSVPPGVWITKMTYSDAFPGSGTEKRTLLLEGAIKSESKDGREDMALGNSFRDALVSQPTIRKICGADTAIRYPSVAGTGAKNASAGRASFSNENNTRFTFTCSKAGGN